MDESPPERDHDGGAVHVDDGVELLRHERGEVVAGALRPWKLDDANGALKARAGQRTGDLRAAPEGEEEGGIPVRWKIPE